LNQAVQQIPGICPGKKRLKLLTSVSRNHKYILNGNPVVGKMIFAEKTDVKPVCLVP